jgi:RecB family exonuclease
VAQQRRRMLHDLKTFIVYDWDEGRPRSFVAAERPFGWSAPFSVRVDGQPLFLRGEIDRLDVQDGRTLLRDLKTGKPKPRRPGDAPDHIEDLQIGLYALVSKAHAKAWSLPAELDVAYIYPKGSRKSVRRFADEDYDMLEGKTREWLKVARGLLRDGAFPRTPRADDCKYCSFKPVCGIRANERGREVIAGQPAMLTDFGDLKEKV